MNSSVTSASARPTPPWYLNAKLLLAAYAAVLVVAPLIGTSGFARTLLSQMGIAIIACLAYNVIFGQGGMLSFGHAVYSGLGSFLAIHTLNLMGQGKLSLPVSLVPLVGGVAGLFFAALLGHVTTRKAGTTFAMITLGIGELVWSMSLMLPEFFGGEGGISGNRVQGQPFLGISFGPQIEVYYLIAAYCFVSTAALYALTLTPLGRMLNAVRDNPERVEFIGYNTRRVRYIAFMISGFFAGIAGGLAAVNFELVTAEVVGAGRSGAYLLFVFLGGATFFIGPIIGAVLMVVALVLLSEWTKAWLLYLGLVFLFMVMYAPGGIASLIMMNMRVAAFGRLRRLIGHYAVLAVGGTLTALASASLIEMVYHRQMNAAMGSELRYLGLTLDSASVLTWSLAAAAVAAGGALTWWAKRRFGHEWHAVQSEIEQIVRAREAA